MFSSTKHNDDFSFEENDDMHRLDRVNFSRPCVAIPQSQPNSVNDLQVHGPSCSSHTMYFKVSQGGLVVMWGWHVEY